MKKEFGMRFIIMFFLFGILSISGFSQSPDCGDGDESGEHGSPPGGGSLPDPGEDFSWPTIRALDPNEIIGPAGYDSAQWVSVKDTLNYTAYFENDPDFATAAAQIVEVYVSLDPHVNPFSVRLHDFGFGDFDLQIPAGSGFYQTRIDVSDSLGVLVDFSAGLDFSNNRISWRFETLDPNTLLPPTDATLGFLPVNDSLRRLGEGYVKFSVVPLASSQTGDTIFKQAEIFFDDNPPIVTNTYFNTIDALPPTLTVAPVAALVQDTFQLDITFEDDSAGSGTDSYDLYLSIDGDPLITLALGIRQDTSIRFQGRQNREHCVYSLARDNVTNILANTTNPLTCFLVRDTAYVDITTPDGGAQYCVGDTVPITWQYKNVDLVSLEYSPDAGTTFFPLADSLLATDTSFQWILNSSYPVSSTYLIKAISTLEDTIINLSEQVFSVGYTPAPVLAQSDTAICAGEILSLSVQGTYEEYYWSTGDTTATIDVSTAGIYALSVVGANGCPSDGTDEMTLTVNPLPATPVINASGPLAFCENDNVSLTAPAGFTYLWNTGETSQQITVASSGTFSVQVIDANGCLSPFSAPVAVTVNPLPAQPIVSLSGPTTFCADDSLILSGPPGFSYLWSSGGTSPNLFVNQSGTYSLVIMDGNGCESPASLTTTVQVNALPAQPTIATSGSPILCESETVSLSGPAGFSYIWSNGLSSQSFSVDTAGTFTLAVVDGNSCGSPVSAPLTVQVNPLPAQPIVQVSGDSVICAGETVSLIGPSGYTYLWSNGDTTQTLVTGTSGSFSLEVIDGNGCVSPASTVTNVQVNPLPAQPIITASGSTTICDGDSITLSAPAGFDYLWSNGDTSASIAIHTAETLTLAVIDGNGCTSPVSVPISISISPLPAQPQILASGLLAICQTDSVTLSGPAGFDYLWTTGATTQNLTIGTSGTFALQVIDANGCISPASLPSVVTVNPLPAQPQITASDTLTFCVGETVTLSAPTGFTYLWSNADTTQDIIVSQSGTFTVSVRDVNGCLSPASPAVQVTVNPLPVQPTILPSGPLAACDGDTLTLNAPAGFTYLWSNGATQQDIAVTTSGAFDVVIQDANGCENSSATSAVTFYSLPAQPTITPLANLTACEGDTVSLMAPAGFSYQWSNGDTTQVVSIVNSTSLSLVTIDSIGCESPASASVSVVLDTLPLQPTIVANQNPAICTGDSVILSGPAGYFYLWSNGDTTASITVTNTDTLSLSLIDGNGCVSPASISMQVSVDTFPVQPVILANGPLTICAGTDVQLFGPSGWEYLWSTGDTTESILASASGSYSLAVFSPNGCASPDADSVAVEVIELPQMPGITLVGQDTFCVGDSVILTSSPGFEYVWSTGDSSQSITVTETGVYSLFVRDSIGCESPISELIAISVEPLPANPMIVSTQSTLCTGDSITLSTSTSTASSYLWSTGDISQSITLTAGGTYSVLVFNELGCAALLGDSVTITEFAQPAQPEILVLGNDSLFASVLANTYQWFVDGIPLVDSTQGILATQSGTYTVLASNGPCASMASDTVNVTVTDITKDFLGGSIRVYPNPNRGVFVIDGAFLQTNQVEVSLFNALSQEIALLEFAVQGGILHEEINLEDQPEGVYFVAFRAGGKVMVQRVVIIH